MNFSKTNSTYSSYANDDFFNLNISQKMWCNILNSMRCKVGLAIDGILVEKETSEFQLNFDQEISLVIPIAPRMILLEKLVNKSIVISVIGLAPVITKLVRSNYKK